jgi:hypothetical protein
MNSNSDKINIKDILVDQIINLVNDMLIVFPNDKLFILCRNNFDLLKNNKDEIILNVNNELLKDEKIRKYVNDKDEKLFEISYINYLNINKFSLIMTKLKTNWKKLDNINKDKVWDYFSIFILLLDKLK